MKKFLTPKVVLLIAVSILAIMMVIMMLLVFSQFKSVKVSAGEGGRVFGGGDYRENQLVEVNAIPDEGYFFDGWYNKDETIPRTRNELYVFRMPNDNVDLKAKFAPYPNHVIDVKPSLTEGGVANGGIKTYEGAKVTISATANSGYTFIGWYVEDLLLSNENTITFSMPKKDMTITARFMPGTVLLYELKVNPDSAPLEGVVMEYYAKLDGYSAPFYKYPAGATVVLTAVTAHTTDTVSWILNPDIPGALTSEDQGRTAIIIMPDSDLIVSTIFTENINSGETS